MENLQKMNQKERILHHLEEYGKISRYEALLQCGVVELPARITELKAAGHKITSKRITAFNKYGKTHYNEYYLEDTKNECKL